MSIQRQRNIAIEGANGRTVLVDAFYEDARKLQPVVVFAHGFKGFKDWGTFDLIGERFVEAGFGFIKFNFSHNGVPPEAPYEITDKTAFGENNYTKELTDLDSLLEWVRETSLIPAEVLNREDLTLVGHSRGGSVTIIKTCEDERVTRGISWSAPADLAARWTPSEYESWQKEGVFYVVNGRNGESLPLYWQLAEDMEANQNRFDLEQQVQQLSKPLMVAHGTEDEAVPQEEALKLKSWNSQIKLELIPGASHTYGGYHPYPENKLPQSLGHLLKACFRFIHETA